LEALHASLRYQQASRSVPKHDFYAGACCCPHNTTCRLTESWIKLDCHAFVRKSRVCCCNSIHPHRSHHLSQLATRGCRGRWECCASARDCVCL
jgi:hypothetical protein